MRRLLTSLLALPVLLFAAHFALWRWADQQIEQRTADWIAAQRAAGWTIRSDPGIAGGWPLAAEWTLPNLVISGDDTLLPGGLVWRSERLTLQVALLHPSQLTVSLEGPQDLTLGRAAPLRLVADTFTASVPLTPAEPPHSADVHATQLHARIPGQPDGGGITVDALTAHVVTARAVGKADAALTVALQAGGIALPAGVDWGLGPTIARLSCDAAVDGPVGRGQDLMARLTAWRDAGGTLPIQNLSLTWGPLTAAASATLSLDDQLQPIGAATARIAGWGAALDAMVAAHVMPARTALAAKAVLSLLARPAADAAGVDAVEAPLTVQQQTLSFGRIPLARLPSVVWPP